MSKVEKRLSRRMYRTGNLPCNRQRQGRYRGEVLKGNMKIIRIFPRKTKATPDDEFVGFGPPGLFLPKADEVHISVAFTWDIPKAEKLAEQWKRYYPTKIGGPALNQPGGDFIPGRYLKKGYVITSRGCPNNCWFCAVPKREGNLRELPITEGYNVLDDNLLACSEGHIRKVFDMLREQKEKITFSGGFEAKILKDWHIDLLKSIRIAQMFFAYDTQDDYKPLVEASKKLRQANYSRYEMRCYVLIGYPKDTLDKAEKRLKETISLGFFPMAMLYRDESGKRNWQWMKFQKAWARPASIYRMCKKI